MGGGYSRSASDASASHMALPSLYHDGEEFEVVVRITCLGAV